jgi:hypothetical protein
MDERHQPLTSLGDGHRTAYVTATSLQGQILELSLRLARTSRSAHLHTLTRLLRRARWLRNPLSVMMPCHPALSLTVPIFPPGEGLTLADAGCESLYDFIPKASTADGDGCIRFTYT